MADASNTPLARALTPLVRRVRTDVTAVKRADGSRWTNEPLTDEALLRHVNGGPARGVCPIKAGESVTMVALLDFDSHKGETTWPEMIACARAVIELLECDGNKPVAFRSSGGKGIHIYLLWEQPQDAYSVRAYLADVLACLGYANGTKGVKFRQVEIFPKQDVVEIGGYGNQFILPLAGKSEPLDPLFDYEPMGKAFITQIAWEDSPPVERRAREERQTVSASNDGGFEPLARVRSALFAVPNQPGEFADAPDYDRWRDLVFAVHEATGGSQAGLDLVLEWSEQNPDKHDPKFLTERVWPYINSAQQRRGSAITRGTLFAEAARHDWADTTGIDSDGFEDVPQQQIAEARALITRDKAAAAETRAESLGERRDALVRLREQFTAAEDSIALKAVAVPAARLVLQQFPDLRTEVSAMIKARAKDFELALTQSDLTKMLAGPSQPTVKTARPLTEFGNAQRMLDKFGDGLMYVPEIEQWYVWTGVYWRKANGVEIEHCAKEAVLALVDEIDDIDPDKLADFFEHCRQSQRAAMVRNMVTLAASDPKVMVPVAELDKHAHYLGVKNGVVDLRTGQLLPPSQECRVTLTAGCNYDPNAKCPLFDQTLLDVFCGDQDMADYMMTCFGYALCGEPTEDKMFIAFGNGSNGKSTIFNAVRKAFGQYARSADASTFLSDGKGGGAGGPREDLVRLMGARFVYVNEPDENGELKEGTVKSMTGGDAIPARAMFAKTSVEIEPTWTVFMPTNHKPIIKGTDNGIWRRLVLLPFERNFDEDKSIQKDPLRQSKLAAELEGILAALVRAAIRFKKTGFFAPAKVQAARDAYRTNMDLLAEWLEECCEVGASFEVPTQHLWASWESYAKSRGLLNYINSSVRLSRRLDGRFETRKGTGGIRMRMGLRLKDDFSEVLP